VAYDVIVAGAGSAGCVAAARLTADERWSVLVVEAGPDYPTVADLPDDIADASLPTLSHDWGFAAEPDALGRSVPLPRGRLVGGCSATNAGFAVRGWPADYDGWAARGNPGWSFAELLPVFRAVEADAPQCACWPADERRADAPGPGPRPARPDDPGGHGG